MDHMIWLGQRPRHREYSRCNASTHASFKPPTASVRIGVWQR